MRNALRWNWIYLSRWWARCADPSRFPNTRDTMLTWLEAMYYIHQTKFKLENQFHRGIWLRADNRRRTANAVSTLNFKRCLTLWESDLHSTAWASPMYFLPCHGLLFIFIISEPLLCRPLVLLLHFDLSQSLIFCCLFQTFKGKQSNKFVQSPEQR